MGDKLETARLTLSNCVVLGSWNPAILQPGWMTKQGILPNGEAKIELATPVGLPISMPLIARYTLAGLSWVAQPVSLQVQPVAEDANPGEFVAAILEKLEHTPVRAVGNNFHFDPGAVGGRLLDRYRCAGWEHLRGTAEEVGSQVGIKLSHDTGVLNVTIVCSPTGVTELHLNFHREMVDAGEAVKAARKWTSDRSAAKDLVARIVGEASQ